MSRCGGGIAESNRVTGPEEITAGGTDAAAAAALALEEQALRPCGAEALALTIRVSMQSLIHLGNHGVQISLPLQQEPKATTNLNAIAPSK